MMELAIVLGMGGIHHLLLEEVAGLRIQQMVNAFSG